MNTEMSPSNQLRAAAKLIDRAKKQLDVESVACKCCGRFLAKNVDEAKLYETLAELPRKLDDAADRFDNFDAPRSAPGYEETLRSRQ